VATLAKAPRLTDEEIEPYSIKEVQRLLEEAGKRRNSARWALAPALGLRQSEALGLKWSDVDLDVGTLSWSEGGGCGLDGSMAAAAHAGVTMAGIAPNVCRNGRQRRTPNHVPVGVS
jgi:integrase